VISDEWESRSQETEIRSQNGFQSEQRRLRVHTLQASRRDPRVKTLVLLTALEPKEEAKQFLTTSNVPIFAIASSEDNNYQRGRLAESIRQVYLLSRSKQSEFLLYDDAGRGSEMLKVKPELQPMILRWLGDNLQGIIPTRVNPYRRHLCGMRWLRRGC